MRLFRDVADVLMDLNDLEGVIVKTLGGADTLTVNDLSGTDVTDVVADLGLLGNPATDPRSTPCASTARTAPTTSR